MILDMSTDNVRFALEKLGDSWHVVATDRRGKLLNLVDGAESRSRMECSKMLDSIRNCEQCKRQAVGFAGSTHFGSRNCRCHSLASGGHRSHCACDTCY